MPKKRYHAVKDDLAALVESKKKSDELSKRREEELLQTIVAMQQRIEQLEGKPLLYQLTYPISRLCLHGHISSLRYHDGDVSEMYRLENIKIAFGQIGKTRTLHAHQAFLKFFTITARLRLGNLRSGVLFLQRERNRGRRGILNSLCTAQAPQSHVTSVLCIFLSNK